MYKFNNGSGAIICDMCRIIIRENVNHTEDAELCTLCLECVDSIEIKEVVTDDTQA